MWVNVNHLLRYMNDYNPFLLDLKVYSTNNEKDPKIKIPAYSMLNKLVGEFTLLNVRKFR